MPNKLKDRFETLAKRIKVIDGLGRVRVAVCGTLTLELELLQAADPESDSSVSKPSLGGTGYFLSRAMMMDSTERFDVELRGPRSPLHDENRALDPWQTMFADCVNHLEDEGWRARVAELERNDKLVPPVTIRVVGKDGSRIERHQAGPNRLKWESYLPDDQLERPGLVIIDGIWRFGLYNGLHRILRKLREAGWIIALHPGNFRLPERHEELFETLREAFESVDVLFGTPSAVARLLADSLSDPAAQQVDAMKGFLYSDHPRFRSLPTIVVVADSKMNLEVVLPDTEQPELISPLTRSELAVPSGLRSTFVGRFLLELWREFIRPKKGHNTRRIKHVLTTSLESALRTWRTPAPVSFETTRIPEHDPAQERIIGSSVHIKDLKRRVRVLAPTELNILLLGETGVGKGLTANELHMLSTRHLNPFIPVNCATLARGSELANSELFGHVKGAFTGAEKDRVGCVELAHKGTLFLDEIGDMPEDVQAKLLRAIDEKKFCPLGSSEEITSDFRLISATNDPRRMRKDLSYRLGLLFRIPALRERKEDIPTLVEQFVSTLVEQSVSRSPDFSFDANAIEELKRHDWPGNVRELDTLVTFFATVNHKSPTNVEIRKWIREQSASSIGQSPNDVTETAPGRAARANSTELLSAALRYIYDRLNNTELDRYLRILGRYFENPLAEHAPDDFRETVKKHHSALNSLKKRGVLVTIGIGRNAKTVLADGWRAWFQQLPRP